MPLPRTERIARLLSGMLLIVVGGCALEPEEHEVPVSPTRVRGIGLELAGPYVIGLTNALGSSLTAPPSWTRPGPGLLAGLKTAEGGWTAPRGQLERTQASAERSALTVTSFGQPGRGDVFGQLRTLVRPDDDGLILSQSGELQPASAAVGWGLVLPEDVTIYVPGHDGLLFDADSALGTWTFRYPWYWEAPFVLVHRGESGWLIRADDGEATFKSLSLARTPDGFRLRFEVEATPPLRAETRAPETAWHLEPYQGSWVVGAERYRRLWRDRFAERREELPGPDWVDEIGLVVRHELEDRDSLEALAQRIDPRHVLLYSTSWRRAGFDRDYPTYVERAGLAGDLAWAKARGFRVMLHVNFLGCSYDHPAWESLRPFQVKDLGSGQPREWRNENVVGQRFAIINPASRQWQTFFVAEMERVVRRLQPDALHLDQNGNFENDGNGRIDGATMMEGGLFLHEALRRALRGVALSGEDLNELTAPFLDFSQRRAFGAEASVPFFRWAQLLDAHAVNSYLFGDWVESYGSLATISSERAELRLPWAAAYDRWGMLPTWSPSSPRALGESTPMTESLLAAARWRASFAPTVSHDARDWDEGALFAFRGGDGELVRIEETETGWAYTGAAAPPLNQVHGARELDPAWWIPDWPAVSEHGRAALLDPESAYVAIPRGWRRQEPWIEVPAGTEAVLEHAVRDESVSWVKLGPGGRPILDLLRVTTGVVSGLRTELGVEPVRREGMSLGGRGSGGVWRLDAGVQLAAPPVVVSSDVRDRRHPRVFVEWRIDLPPRPTRLELTIGPPEFRRTAPARLRVEVRAGEYRDELLLEYSGDATEQLEIDLPAGGDSRATVRVELLAPENSGDAPSEVVLREVRLLPATGPAVELQLQVPREPIAVSGAEQGAADGNALTVKLEVPGTVAVFHPSPNVLPWLIDEGGRVTEEALRRLGSVAPRAIGRDSRPAHGVSPDPLRPERRLVVGRVPEAGGRFRGAVAVANPLGRVEFRIEIDGRPLWSRRVEGSEAWEAFDLDLSPWAGRPVAIELVTDPLGSHVGDWAVWSFRPGD